MGKFKCFAFTVITFMIVSFFTITSNAKIIYKDINSISLRTNFSFDYESISEDGVGDVTWSNDGDTETNVYIYGVDSSGNHTKAYEIESAEWYRENTDDFSIGSEPKVIVYLATSDYDYERATTDNEYYYRFLSSYNSSNCAISNATFVSATRISNDSLKVIFKIKPIKGTYNAPTSAYWLDNAGNAIWEPDNILNSGYFEVSLYRNSNLVHRLEKYNGTKFNFWQYMTKEGEYMFKVRTVPGTDKQMVSGKPSEYQESNSILLQEGEINKNAQAGTNTTTGTTTAGWLLQNGKWYFYQPNGTMLKSSWTFYNNKWYYLDQNGEMLTGLQTINGNEYYFQSNGDMFVGWLKNGAYYSYYDTTKGSHEGAKCKNAWILFQGKYFYFDNQGVMATGWKEVADSKGNMAFYYFYPEGTTSGLFGYMATNTTINGFAIGADGKWIAH